MFPNVNLRVVWLKKVVSNELELPHWHVDTELNEQGLTHSFWWMWVKMLIQGCQIRFAICHVDTLIGKSLDVVDTTIQRRTNIVSLKN